METNPTSKNESIADAMRAAHQYLFGMGWNDDPEWRRAQHICSDLTQAIYAMPQDETTERSCACIPMAPRPWKYCANCGGRIPMEPSAYEELRKRATRLIVAMRRDRWEGHDHGYTNDLAALLNIGLPMEPECRSCGGSGTTECLHGAGPDAYPVEIDCPKCKGTGVVTPEKLS